MSAPGDLPLVLASPGARFSSEIRSDGLILIRANQAWIAALHPDLILLSVAADDYDGLPSLEAPAAVRGYTLLCTVLNCWIELTTDGEAL